MESVKCCGCRIGVDFAKVGMEELLKASKDKPWLEELLIGSALPQDPGHIRTLSDTQHFPLHPIEVLKRRRKQLQLS
jgi:hypothetical protein